MCLSGPVLALRSSVRVQGMLAVEDKRRTLVFSRGVRPGEEKKGEGGGCNCLYSQPEATDRTV